MLSFRYLMCALLLIFSQSLLASELLDVFYLTFEEEETWSSITVNFQSTDQSGPGQVYYDTESRAGKISSYTYGAKGRMGRVAKNDLLFHHVKLSRLSPATTYYFIAGSSESGYSREMKFKTLPSDDTPIRMVIGGDMGTERMVADTPASAMTQNPHVILIGGDIAYANGRRSNGARWNRWFTLMNEVMTTPSGYLIPLIVAIGNHEISSKYYFLSRAPWYFELFPQGLEQAFGRSKSYFTRKLGNHSALIVLDSGHYHSHSSQRRWLTEQLKKYSHLPNRLALYHAPLFPNHRDWGRSHSRKGLMHWQPLFDKYNLTAAFEHHDHTLKRTFPIRGDTVARKGTIYIGDGCWGLNPRESNPDKWYLALAQSVPHVWTVTVDEHNLNMMASGAGGRIFDHINVINKPNETIVQQLLK